MKRTPLRRGAKPMKRTQLRRKKRINPVNRTRKHRRFEHAYESVARVLWYRSRGCVVCGLPSEMAHVTRSRGNGGTANDCTRLCHSHHRVLHDVGRRAFERGHGVNLIELAETDALKWRVYIGA